MNEQAFEYLNQQKRPDVKSSISNYISDDAKIYTCTIGLKSTNANYYLEQAEITFTLKKLRQDTVHRKVRPDGRRVQSQANFRNTGNFLFGSSNRSIKPNLKQ